jgi:hypothetical protein
MTISNPNTYDDLTTEESSGDVDRRYDADRIDERFEVLADARRRRALRYLSESDETVTSVQTLAETVAAREQGNPPPDRVLVSLRHVHLPKLDAADVLDYASDRSEVRYEGAPVIERLLERC